jgi:hypothetical protein
MTSGNSCGRSTERFVFPRVADRETQTDSFTLFAAKIQFTHQNHYNVR